MAFSCRAAKSCRLCSPGTSQHIVQLSQRSREIRRFGSFIRNSRPVLPLTNNNNTATGHAKRPGTEVARGNNLRNVGGSRRALATDSADSSDRRAEIYALIDNIHQHEDEISELLEDIFPFDDYDNIIDTRSWEMDNVFSGTIGHRDYESLENKVRQARQDFGEYLPEDYLNDVELELYNRLYGEAIMRPAMLEDDVDEREPDVLLKDDGEGGFEEIDLDHVSDVEADIPVAYDMEEDILDQDEDPSAIDRARQIAERLNGVLLEPGAQVEEEEESESGPRLHPVTEAGKFSTSPRTVFIPQDSVTGPISVILSSYSNKHIAEAAHKIFGGQRLPHSTTTLPPSAQIAQKPIPLSASQHHMSDMEANAYLAALYPGIYASTLSVLAEVRKRLGSQWLRGLMTQETGPRVLDVGGSGASILAWRDVLRAEYETMVPDHPRDAPIPTGKSTVLLGSDALQMRASTMLENTTFLPRLPDYIHVRDGTTLEDDRAPPKRKQFDIIIAPHTLLEIDEDYLRKQHVKNLWTMLSPNGGVLILLEKGRQKGFEAIAGARQMLLDKHIASPGSTEYESLTESGDQGSIKKESGMIIAPCTNHGKCPMYHISGHAKGRGDYCHFEQRYIRPPFLQRILGAKDRNHEDVEFSYVAVQRGVDMRQTESIMQGKSATDAAFEGYEENIEITEEDMETTVSTESSPSTTTTTTTNPPFNSLSLPRTVLPPMKRRGHVIFDFCTPEGKIERWTVPRSFSRQAYHDARKARWGDLWALGAKTRIPRNLRLGSAESAETKKERLKSRAASKLAQMEGNQPEEEDEGDAELDLLEAQEEQRTGGALADALKKQASSFERRKKGHNIPSWKRHNDKKRIRQAVRKASSNHSSAGEFI